MGRRAPDLPAVRPGARIGLLGGSFDPAHEGHLAISLRALHQARLDWVWWLVAAQNPLKRHAPSAPLAQRLAQARRLAGHPLRRIWATDAEARPAGRYALDSVRALQRRFPEARFVLLLGADNLAQLPRWHRWRRLAAAVPLLVAPRPAAPCESLGGRGRAHFAGRLLRREDISRLAETRPPALAFLSGAPVGLSSTMLRRRP